MELREGKAVSETGHGEHEERNGLKNEDDAVRRGDGDTGEGAPGIHIEKKANSVKLIENKGAQSIDFGVTRGDKQTVVQKIQEK